MTGILGAAFGLPAFTPVTYTQTSGSGSTTIPLYAKYVRVTCRGGGAGGINTAPGDPWYGDGGGEGAKGVSIYAVHPAHYGKSISWSVGAAGAADANGGASTASCSDLGLSITANGGSGHTGGSSTGGNSSNTSGANGGSGTEIATGSGGNSFGDGVGMGGTGGYIDSATAGTAGLVKIEFTEAYPS